MKTNFSKKTVSILVGALALLCAPSVLFAQGTPNVPDVLHLWDGPPGTGPNNDWFNAANWDNAGVDTVPGPGDNVQINNTGTAAITGGGAASALNISLGTGSGESGALHVLGTGSTLAAGANFVVGNAGNGTALFRDNTITTVGGAMSIGSQNGSVGDVGIRDTAHLTVSGNLFVGDAGTGSMEIIGAAKVVTHSLFVVGNATGSLGTVDVQGTFSGPGGNDFNLTADGNLIVGNDSGLANTLDIHNGGRVATGASAIIGNNDGSNGLVRVGDDGPNSESYFFIQNNLVVGNSGNGDFRIRDGGFAGTFDGDTFIGRNTDGVGVMSVEGSGLIDGPSLFTTNNMVVGDAGNGSLGIRDVGTVMASGRLVAGNQSKSIGNIDVSGAFTANTSDFNLTSGGFTVIGESGNAVMEIHDGGRVHTIGNGIIGENSDGTGVVRVGGDGPNSEAFWLIGRPNGPIAADAATAAIAGSSPSGVPSNLIVGRSGTGTLNIHDGGLVNVDDGFGDAFIGANAGSLGRVSIDGSGAIQNPPNSTLGARNIFVGGTGAGPGGDGAMRLTNGGTVFAFGNFVVWGPGSGNKGLLEVDSTYILNVAGNLIFDGGELRFLDDTDFINAAVLGNTQSPDGVFVDTNGTTSTISGVFTGPGGLVKGGAGTLIIPVGTADTYTGNTQVRDGTLQLDGSITSNTFVGANGTLTGIGTIFGNLLNDGVVSPGDSPGTLTVTGNYQQTSNGDFVVEVGGLQSGVTADLLTMGGFAQLAGTIHVIHFDNFLPVPDDRVTVLHTDLGRGGSEFETVVKVGWLGLIQPFVEYPDDNTVDVVFHLTDTFASQGITRNEICVGENLDAAVAFVHDNDAAHELIAVLGSLPPEQLPEAFDLIAPEELASMYEISFQHGIMQMSTYRQRMDDLRATARGYCGDEAAPAPMMESRPDGKTVLDGKQTLPDKTVAPVETCPDKRWGMFATGYGQGVNVDDDEFNHVNGYRITTGGFSTGFDALVTHNIAIGVGGGYAQSTADLVNDGRVDVETGYVAAYATAFFGGFYVDGAATGGWSTYDTSRLGFGGFEDGETNGQEFNGIIGAGYDWRAHCFTVGPFATFHYTYVEFDNFDEHGTSLAPLHFPDQNQDAQRGAIGLKASYDMTKGNIIFRPEIRAAFQHEFNNTDYAIDFSFRDIPTGHICDVFGPSTGRDSALIDAGFSLVLGKCHNISAFVFYSGNIGRENDTRHGANGGLRLSF